MIKKIIILFGVIVLFAIFGMLYLHYINYFPDQEVSQIQIQEKINGTYVNERFGYKIICNDSWYVWPYFSREMAVVGQIKLWKSLSFRKEWTVENSEIIFLTDSDQEDLDQFFDEGGLIDITNLPVGHWIQVFPTDIDPDLNKDTLKEKESSRIEVKTIALQNGIRAQQMDITLAGRRTLSVLVPYNFNVELDSGEQAKSLNFVTDAKAGSDSEKAFYEVINSLSFK
ncbi:MAG: hypothetical protein U9N04_00255 [Patescibacteria group bacterium]|nr:hypothetical protein [Patescibacteria group bacterium]